MKLELTKKEFQLLGDLVFIGNWIININRTIQGKAEIKKYELLADKIVGDNHDLHFDNVVLYISLYDQLQSEEK